MQAINKLRFSVPALVLISAVFHLTVGLSLAATEATASTIEYYFRGSLHHSRNQSFCWQTTVYLSMSGFLSVDGVGGTFAHIASHAVDPLIAAAMDVVIILRL